MTITNTTTLTQSQEDAVRDLVAELFETKFTEDFWHFSFEGTRLNLKSMNTQCVFEVHSSKGSFNVLVDLNKSKKGLKKTIKYYDDNGIETSFTLWAEREASSAHDSSIMKYFLKRRNDEMTNMIATRDEIRNQDRDENLHD